MLSQTILADRFELQREVGSGALGTVYEARDRELACNVALKTLQAPGARTFEFLKTEFRIARQLEHRNIALLHELFLSGDHCFFTMELVRGLPFDRAIEERLNARAYDDVATICEQLVHGLDALHEAGFVHRDIKPANVLVESSNRVVLLDFDLAFRGDTSGVEAYGTPAYMAPEALFGRSSARSDWYSVGAMLHEALTGCRPSGGHPPLLSDLRRAMPSELREPLAEVIHGLLDHNASQRLSGADLLRSLGKPVRRTRATPFVGRTAEVDLLIGELVAVRGGRSRSVSISGPAGIGKTAVLERFLEAAGDAVVLRAACSHAELIPLATVDSLVASLAMVVDADAVPMPAEDQAAACIVFPGLFPRATDVDADVPAGVPAETRGRALRAVARILTDLTRERALVIALDDAQWADEPSVEILAEWLALLEDRACCLVTTWRSPLEGDAQRHFLRLVGDAPSRTIELAPLSDSHATTLAEELGATDARAAVELAGGNPLVLVHVCSTPSAGARKLDLSRLGPAQRRLAEVLALALAPLPRGVACRAAELGDQAMSVLRELEGAKLIRLAGDGTGLTPFHDMVRQSALDGLPEERRKAANGRIADELVAVGIESPDVIVPHLRFADRMAEASTRAIVAADAARATLAFEKEAAYLRWATDGCPAEARPDIIRREAIAWRNGGYLEKAAQRLDDFLDATTVPTQAMRLEAAELWVRAGHTRRGAGKFRVLLENAGIRMLESPERQLLSGLWHRARFLLGGLPDVSRVPERSADDERLELLHRAGSSLSMTQVSAGFDLMGRFLTAAIRDPSRLHLIVALGTEAVYEAAIGGAWLERRAERLLAILDRLADGGDVLQRGARLSYRTLAAWEVARWREAADLGHEFQMLVRRELHGHAWDLRVNTSFAASALFFLGDLETYRVLCLRELAAARDRGDPMGVVHLALGDAGLVHLLDDQPQRAWEALRETEPLAPIGPTIETYLRTILEANTLLYEHRAGAAARLMAERQPLLEKGAVLGSQIPRGWYAFTHARAAFASRRDDPPRARRILRTAYRVLKSRVTPAHRAWADHVRLLAQVADGATVRPEQRAAVASRYREADMALFAWAARGGEVAPDVAAPRAVAGWLDPSQG